MFAVHLEAHHSSLEEAFTALTRPELISGQGGVLCMDWVGLAAFSAERW